MKTAVETQFFFDGFEIDAARRVLRKAGKTIALNPKTFDLLLALIEKHGQTVSKNELLDAVWENQFVEEKNLAVHIAALRKALGEGKNENRFIATVPGRGYKFVSPLNQSPDGIIIETEKIERITIEEEIVKDSGPTTKKTIFRVLTFYLLPMALLLAFGGYIWQQWKKNSHPASVSIKRLTTNGQVQTAALSPDGKLFAYVRDDLGKTSLWLGYTGGGNHLQLRPPDETVYEQLTFSPDSSQLYFSMRDERNPTTMVYRIPILGGAPEKIRSNLNIFSLSPDGKQMAFGRGTEDGRVALKVSNLDGKNEREILSQPPSEALVYGSISWSPDSRRMAFSCKRADHIFYHELCVAEISSGKINRLRLPDYRGIAKTVWVKSGDGLIVTAIPVKNFSSVINYQILYVELPSGQSREITSDLNTYNSDISLSDETGALLTIEHRQLNNLWVAPSENLSQAKQITSGSFGKYDGLWGLDWTPDGHLVYTNSDAETQVISVMNADGSGQKELTSPGFVDSALTVSNDGRYVVFHSSRGGGMDIERMDIDGKNMTQLTFGGQNYQPSISPDNRYVYYKCWLKDVGELRRVPIEGGEPETLTDKETGWTTFSPDGRFFAATYLTDKRRLAIFSAQTNQIIKQFDLPKTAIFNMRPRWTPDSRAVVYRDNAFGYWSQSIEGGEPTRLEGLPKEELFTYAWSKDGKQFAFVRGQEIRDVVLLSNLK